MSPPLTRPADFGWFEAHLLELFDAVPTFGPVTTTLAVLAAFGVGVVHAAGPGHGKAVAAGYLAGGHGRPRDAVALGVVVSLMHTGSVVAVGIALFGATRAAAGGHVAFLDDVGAWLRVVAGGLVAAVGVGMLVRQRRRRGPAPPVTHGSDPADGTLAAEPDDAHTHDHGLERLPADVSPLSRQGVLLIGASGGLLPSPAAFLVLATGLVAGQTGVALALVLAFSVGLAATVAAVGLAVVWGRDRLVARLDGRGAGRRLRRWLPTAAAALLVGAGAITAAIGLARLV